jgi:hypothetical protein
VAAKALKPGIEVVGVEAAGYAALYQTYLRSAASEDQAVATA